MAEHNIILYNITTEALKNVQKRENDPFKRAY